MKRLLLSLLAVSFFSLLGCAGDNHFWEEAPAFSSELLAGKDITGVGLMNDPVFFRKIPATRREKPSGREYIDGTGGPREGAYARWGILEDYNFLITYKNLNRADIKYLAKASLVVLDRSQAGMVDDIMKAWKAIPGRDLKGCRVLGYCDGAGVSVYLPEFRTDKDAHRIINPLNKKLRVGGRVYRPGEAIPGSESWFLRDGAGANYTYWFRTSYMMDVANPAYREWYKAFKINRTMGIFDSGEKGSLAGGVLSDPGKGWDASENGEWENYYVKLADRREGKKWYRVIRNDATGLTLEIERDARYHGRYIISDEPHGGFHGVFLDDIWDGLYMEGVKKSLVDEGTADAAGVNFLSDPSKKWEPHQWTGYQVSIEGGPPLTITGNNTTNVQLAGNTRTGPGKSYRIKPRFDWEHGLSYSRAMADFLGAVREKEGYDGIVRYVEERSAAYEGNDARAGRGIVILNTWCEDDAAYRSYAGAVMKRYRHFAMFEALQSSWDMSNEVTKQFQVADWRLALERWDRMKKAVPEGGRGIRIALLGYPHTQQMYLAHLAGSLLLSRAGAGLEDITAGGNIHLDQLYFDMIQSGSGKGVRTIGLPDAGFEEGFVPDPNDPALCYRPFRGAYVYFNPSRRPVALERAFPEDVVDYDTGRKIIRGDREQLILLPRSARFFFRDNSAGRNAFRFLNSWKPFTYYDCNAAWVVFTRAGAKAVRHNSVWVRNGHGSHRKFLVEGDAVIPQGPPGSLFHAGDGVSTVLQGADPKSENIKGTAANGTAVLKDGTIFAVVRLSRTADSAVLLPGIDYLVEYGKGGEKGTWETRIYFLKDFSGRSLTAQYYAQGLREDGTPDPHDPVKETGILYRQNAGFSLRTGKIDRGDCVAGLAEGRDYFLIPEPTRWKWDYRFPALDLSRSAKGFRGNLEIRLNDVLRGAEGGKAIQWGRIDADNALLIDPEGQEANACNGSRAEYDSMKVRRPRVLVYGFTKDPRDGEYRTIAPAARRQNKNRAESRIREGTGLLYDDVVVTGRYDGIEEPASAAGCWGSLAGYLVATGKTVPQAADYFDAVIIMDNFLESSPASPSGKNRFSSWLGEADYRFLKAFGEKARRGGGKLILDVRFGAAAFTWWGGRAPVRHSLLNRGTDLRGDGVRVKGDLSPLFGALTYAGFRFGSPPPAAMVDKKKRREISSRPGTDFRVCRGVPGITDLYDIDGTDYPVYNPWENGGDFIAFVPRSDRHRQREKIRFAKALPNSGLREMKILEGIDWESLAGFEGKHAALTEEFAWEVNTGLLTGYAYYHSGRGRPPVIVWGGAGEDDIQRLIEQEIGTSITFAGVKAKAGKTLYLYYNAVTDMLQIRERNIGRPVPHPFKVGDDLKGEFIRR